MNKLRLLELFGGIGACSSALTRLGIDYEIADYVEIDKYAVKSYNAIHGTKFEPQDIITWDKDIEVDLIMHGSPCQDFSLAGKQAGGDKDSGTRSSLMYETIRIVEKLKPKYVIWENVKNLLSKKHRHNFDAYLEVMAQLGYTNYYQVLNAKDYGIPQNRERVFTISIRKDINKIFVFPQKQELMLRLKDMLEENVDKKYYLSDKMLNCFMSDGTGKYPRRERFLQNMNRPNQEIGNSITTRAGTRPTDNFIITPNIYTYCDENTEFNMRRQKQECIDVGYSEESIKRIRNNIIKGDIINTLTANAMQSVNHNNCALIKEDNSTLQIRKLTPKECWRLMVFTDAEFEKASSVNSNAQLYKQAGNSIVVNVLVNILNNLLKGD